ncbi:MAG: DUF58 domain-containing protein [Spirochaetaceae bacterium]|jgi:uncharacterized protein (DUF58 family)|nr:DUF58 domain-containing protein [Spirochaetaceae bacterium]
MKPGAPLVAASLLWAALGAGAFFFDGLALVWSACGLCLLLFIIGDAWALRFFTAPLSVRREVGPCLSVGTAAPVTLSITAGPGLTGQGKKPLPRRILLFDLYPRSMQCAAFPARLGLRRLKKGGELGFTYTITPFERGAWRFEGVEILLFSPLGLWRRKTRLPCGSAGRSYPDFKRMRAYAGSDLRGILERPGVKEIRRRGQGMEFQSLREYQKGDSVRAIDWRATGRRGKVIIRDYKEEQDQQVLLLLDAGYRLHRREEGRGVRRTQFDSALEAALLVGYTALKHGDSVGAGSFGNAERWLAPRKGRAAFPALMNGLYDLKSAPVPSSLFSGLENALSRLRRRTFIMLISNFREEDGESLSWILSRIQRRHLLLMVSLREQEAESLALQDMDSLDAALERAAAFSYLVSRRTLYKKWEHAGLLTLEASSSRLSASLINRYLEVKRSGRL